MTYQPHPPAADTLLAALIADEQTARRLAEVFADAFFADEVAVSLVDSGHGQWRLTVYFRHEVDESRVRDLAVAATGAAIAGGLRFERVAAKDWVAESLLALKPIAAGRFVVHGGHDRGCAAPNRIAIEIAAALAFGTGHHGSTRGCLLALDRLCKLQHKRPLRRHRHAEVRAKRDSKHAARSAGAVALRGSARRAEHRRVTAWSRSERILDLGTGSGVLAIAAARAFRRPVLASDIDAHAVRIARDNVRLNRSAALVRVCRANGVAAADIRAGAPFDLVFANILLAPLQRLAAPLTRMVAAHGRIVLSGLLNAQAAAARAAYPHFTLERRVAVDGWTTLVLRRAAVLPFRGREN
jgi:ribosomal protein L11 methyltransferase